MKKLAQIILLTFLLTYPISGRSNCPTFSLKENPQNFSHCGFVNPISCLVIKLSCLNVEDGFTSGYADLKIAPAKVLNEYGGYQMIPDMIEFSAVLNEDKVELKWILEKELNHENFIIEKSRDGKKFTTLLNVSHLKNATSYTEYFETDYKPAAYYRLKQRNNEHSEYQYSQVVYAKPVTRFAGLDPVSELRNSQVNEQQNKESLIVVRDKDGAEFSSVVVFSVEDNGIIGVDPSNNIPPGNYLIIASKISAIDKQKIAIK
jgi:hypothetical protein